MDKEFIKKCLEDREIKRPACVGLFKIDRDRDVFVKKSIRNSTYFLEGTEIISKSKVPYLTFIFAHSAMEQRAYALAADFHNYKIEDHICATLYLSKILKKKELVNLLRDAWDTRKEYNYRMDLKSQSDPDVVGKFMKNVLNPYIEEVDKLIAENNKK